MMAPADDLLSGATGHLILTGLVGSAWVVVWWILRNRINPDDFKEVERRQIDHGERLSRLEGRLNKHIRGDRDDSTPER